MTATLDHYIDNATCNGPLTLAQARRLGFGTVGCAYRGSTTCHGCVYEPFMVCDYACGHCFWRWACRCGHDQTHQLKLMGVLE